jgi:hypothetical protein
LKHRERGFEALLRHHDTETLAERGLAAAVLKTEGPATGVWVRAPRSPPVPSLLSSAGPERRFPKPKAARCSRSALGLRPVAEATSCKASLAERIVQEASDLDKDTHHEGEHHEEAQHHQEARTPSIVLLLRSPANVDADSHPRPASSEVNVSCTATRNC